MSTPGLLSDELLRQLMAVGQVDVLVGLPTLDNAATVGQVVHAVHTAFGTTLKRERTVLLSTDAGSRDGTPEIVRKASLVEGETLLSAQPLRTRHDISAAPYHGLPGKARALRALFVAAELLDAKAVVLLDPDVASVTPGWVADLARPILRERRDYAAPFFSRAPSEGMLVSQLARPVVRATYGRRLREPLSVELGCSPRFVTHCLAQDFWEDPASSEAVDVWLTLTALAGAFNMVQVPLGPRVLAPRPDRPGLPEVFRQVVGALLRGLDRHAPFWLEREGSEPVEVRGAIPPPAAGEPPDHAPFTEAFRRGVRDLEPVLGQVLEAGTLAELRATGAREPLELADELWASTVEEFVAAHRRAAIHRDHVIQALVPLYLGRTASFLASPAARDSAAREEADEALALAFERRKPDLVRRWRRADAGGEP